MVYSNTFHITNFNLKASFCLKLFRFQFLKLKCLYIRFESSSKFTRNKPPTCALITHPLSTEERLPRLHLRHQTPPCTLSFDALNFISIFPRSLTLLDENFSPRHEQILINNPNEKNVENWSFVKAGRGRCAHPGLGMQQVWIFFFKKSATAEEKKIHFVASFRTKSACLS